MISSGIIYGYYAVILKVDEEEFGGHGALLQEGLFASITLFLVICCCDGSSFSSCPPPRGHSVHKSRKERALTVLQPDSSFYICAAFVDSSLQFSTLLIRKALEVLLISPSQLHPKDFT